MGQQHLTFIDLIIPPFYCIIFFFISNSIKKRNIERDPSYRYYMPGMIVKMIGSISICLVYIFYYGGGDTLSYFHDCVTISKAFMKEPFQMLRLTFGNIDGDIWYSFDYETDWLIYAYDNRALWVDRFCWIFALISFNSLLGATMLLSFVCYQGIWRLYQTLIYEFPTLQRQMAFATFFIPSVVFWGSGILKD